MLGVSLSFYKKSLTKVPVHLNTKPVESFDLEKALGKEAVYRLSEDYEEPFDFKQVQNHRIPLDCLNNLSFDQMCKLKLSSFIMFESKVEDLFRNNLNYRLIQKITNSIWRWGGGRSKWNDVVDVYNAITNFKLPGFDIRLDYTTYYNECGGSEYTRTFLDGVFAYLVYHKGKHVMTIGFSVSNNRKILLQQVQLTERLGNRWLFKLPSNYLEYIIQLFIQQFPKHKIYIVDSKDNINKYIKQYKSGLSRVRDSLEYYRERVDRCSTDKHALKWVEEYEKDYRSYEEDISHIKLDAARIESFYCKTGNYKRSNKLISLNGIRHYPIIEEGSNHECL